MRNYVRRLGVGLTLSVVCMPAMAQTVSPKLYPGLVWRNIGPFRGGRVSAVTGVIGQPGVFYMGLPAGGVWKTTGAGTTWVPISDSIKEACSVGAIEVAPSDPNVIYVGMGDMIIGGGICEGNGVYKSSDAGATWRHMGLENSKHIPSILVDPHDPNLVMVAAQGDIHKKSETRGLFRSTDGGQTWTKTLYVDDQTGVQRIAWAYDHPEIMLATTVRHYNAPGGGGGGFGGGGPSSTKLFKSTDKGVTWKEITGSGLPALSGRTCVAIAMNTNARRMFLVGNFGLYRSDDGGETWRQMDSSDRRVANGQGGYNCGVYVDSQNPDIVYVVNTCCYRSTDGGSTFTGFKGAPGGDDPQQIWIDPTDGKRIFFGTDQGATISLDGGQTWSSWYNQPTAQVYHISVDNQFPYWVYATQQDSGSIATASRGNLGEIGPLDWLPHPGFEFGSIVADPLNPKVSYAGGESGGIVKVTYPSGQRIDVSPNVDTKLGLRKGRNQPLLFSPTNPHELFAPFQYVMSTTDGGKTWKKLSPDLSRAKGEPEPAPAAGAPQRGGGNVMVEEEDEEDEAQMNFGGGAIDSISVSTMDGKTIWAGTNNGHIWLTRDHGTTWDDVTIPGLPNPTRADISAIDASHHDPGTAYAAVDCHTVGDYKPYVYRTHDYGKSWMLITKGLPENLTNGSFARVIRADTKRAGLLFVGTESSVYVSFDDGENWQSLALNLPTTSYRDMVVKDNDLVVGTYGRGFWILDDFSPLRQIAASTATDPARLFKPADAVRLRRNVNGDTPFPPEIPHAPNPPVGALVYYYLGAPPAGEITLDVTDSAGKPVRHMSSLAVKTPVEPPPPIPDFWVETPKALPTEVGLNRINWNLRYDNPPAFSHSYEINANPGETPPSPEGPLVPPGVYTLTLKANRKNYSQTVVVKNDPRSPATSAELRAQHELQVKLYRCAMEAWEAYQKVSALRTAVSAIAKTNPPAEVTKAASELDGKLTALAGSIGFGRRFGGGGAPGGGASAPRQPTFAALNGSAVRMLKSFETGDMAPTEAANRITLSVCADMDKAMKTWEAIRSKDLVDFNTLLVKDNIRSIGPSSANTPEPLISRYRRTSPAPQKAVTHPILAQDRGHVVIMNGNGEIEWEVPCPYVCHDIAMLPNGNVLFPTSNTTIVEMTRDKQIVWKHESHPQPPYTGRVEIHGFQRLKNGLTMIAETGNMRIIEVDKDDKIVHEVPITVDRPDSHRDTRRVHKLDNGNYLACHEGDGVVREYDPAGKVVWSYKLDLVGQPRTQGHDGHGTEVFNAVRLSNGNTLIGGGNNNRVFEVTPEGKTVWSIERDELPGIHLCWITTLQVLPNGHIIFGNTHAGPDNPQLIEVTRDKKVVWTFKNWTVFGNDLVASQVLDVKGKVIR